MPLNENFSLLFFEFYFGNVVIECDGSTEFTANTDNAKYTTTRNNKIRRKVENKILQISLDLDKKLKVRVLIHSLIPDLF